MYSVRVWCHFARRSECAQLVFFAYFCFSAWGSYAQHHFVCHASMRERHHTSTTQIEKAAEMCMVLMWLECEAYNMSAAIIQWRPHVWFACDLESLDDRRPISDDQRESSWHWPRRTFTRNRNVACVQFGNRFVRPQNVPQNCANVWLFLLFGCRTFCRNKLPAKAIYT